MDGLDTNVRHVLGLSGGRDSAALAIYMRQNHPELEIDYFFTDTGKELPEVYEFLVRLEGFLGKSILRLNPDRTFDFWLAQYKNFLPSPKTRWCTRQLKIKPFEEWLKPELEGARSSSATSLSAATRIIVKATPPLILTFPCDFLSVKKISISRA